MTNLNDVFSTQLGWPQRADFSGLLTEQEVLLLAHTPTLRTLQFDRPVHPDNWPLLEEYLFSCRPDVCLRAYGHYSQNCNVSFVKHLPSLQNFRVECDRKVSGLQAIELLPNLRHLSIGVYDLENFNFLSTVSTGLKTLTLGPTSSTRPDISIVSRFEQLEELFIGGHLKGLQILPSLPHLGKLRFSGLKSPKLDFLAKIPNLWSLQFLLGGGEDFSPIAGVNGLKHLELIRIRRLKDVSFISECTNVQKLSLEQLAQVKSLPNFERLNKIRRLTVISNNLRSVDPIGAAPALEVFSGSAGSLWPNDFRVALQAPSLRKATVYFGSRNKEREFKSIAAEYGVNTEAKWEEFVFI